MKRLSDESSERLTLPELSDGGCDELQGEVHQVLFRTLSSKLFWFLGDKESFHDD